MDFWWAREYFEAEIRLTHVVPPVVSFLWLYKTFQLLGLMGSSWKGKQKTAETM